MNKRNDHAVLIILKRAYDPDQLAELEDALSEAVVQQRVGELDGNEIGLNESTIYLYGPNADLLFLAVERILTKMEVFETSRVFLRYGGPGSPQNEAMIARRSDAN